VADLWLLTEYVTQTGEAWAKRKAKSVQSVGPDRLTVVHGTETPDC
jgi:hypothetical protein